MRLRLIATIVTGAAAATLWSAAFGQANPQNSGYVLFGYGKPDAQRSEGDTTAALYGLLGSATQVRLGPGGQSTPGFAGSW